MYKEKSKKIKIFLFCLIGAASLSISQIALGAEMSLLSSSSSFALNEEVEIYLFLNTQGENINALEGTIDYPLNLSLIKIKEGDSIVSFWVKKPEEKNRIIRFAGIIPGGFQGRKGKILSLIFRPKEKGKGTIQIKTAKVLLNDGKGTETKTSIKNLQFTVEKNNKKFFSSSRKIKQKDLHPPEPFKPIITRSPNLFQNKYFLVFVTQDKESGIDHYEVCEGNQDCQWATSPYLLKNQKLNQKIIVKAIDKEGNIRTALIPPLKSPQKRISKIYFLLIPIIIIIGGLILYFYLNETKRKE